MEQVSEGLEIYGIVFKNNCRFTENKIKEINLSGAK
jgi:hypothetical protein